MESDLDPTLSSGEAALDGATWRVPALAAPPRCRGRTLPTRKVNFCSEGPDVRFYEAADGTNLVPFVAPLRFGRPAGGFPDAVKDACLARACEGRNSC